MAIYWKIDSTLREEIIDLTDTLGRIVKDSGWKNGAVHLFCCHTTCGLTINENFDPDVKADLMRFFAEIAPRSHGWLHREGNTDAHIRASLLGPSLLVPVGEGRLLLGKWQSVYLYEGDGPRQRHIWVQFFAEQPEA